MPENNLALSIAQGAFDRNRPIAKALVWEDQRDWNAIAPNLLELAEDARDFVDVLRAKLLALVAPGFSASAAKSRKRRSTVVCPYGAAALWFVTTHRYVEMPVL